MVSLLAKPLNKTVQAHLSNSRQLLCPSTNHQVNNLTMKMLLSLYTANNSKYLYTEDYSVWCGYYAIPTM